MKPTDGTGGLGLEGLRTVKGAESVIHTFADGKCERWDPEIPEVEFARQAAHRCHLTTSYVQLNCLRKAYHGCLRHDM